MVVILYSLFGGCILAFWRRRPVLVLVLIGGLPVATLIAGVAALVVVGSDAWQLRQFLDRTQAATLLSSLLLVAYVLRRLAKWPLFIRPAKTTQIFSIGALLASFILLCVHTSKIYRYVVQVAVQEYALPKDLEKLGLCLRDIGKDNGRLSMATLSHEINYLAAVWTNFDLILPEGFPLHFNGTNRDISGRMAALLKYFGVSKENWAVFNERMHPFEQESWKTSRVEAERQGYAYFLLHRLEANAVLGDNLFNSTQAVAADWDTTKFDFIHQKPDVVILDAVSSLMRAIPNLNGYARKFESGDVQVWLAPGLNSSLNLSGCH